MTLTKADFARLSTLIRKGDAASWELGDFLVQHTFSRQALREVAENHGRTVAWLKGKQDTALETPVDKRNPSIPFGIYTIFSKIEDQSSRWTLLAGQKSWTTTDARAAVKAYKVGPSKPVRRSSTITVADTPVRVSSAPVDGRGGVITAGEDECLIVKVWRGADNDWEVVEQTDKYTVLKFTPKN